MKITREQHSGISPSYKRVKYEVVNLNDGNSYIARLELHRGDEEVTYPYLSIYWLTDIPEKLGLATIADSYVGFRKNQKLPLGLEDYVKEFQRFDDKVEPLWMIISNNDHLVEFSYSIGKGENISSFAEELRTSSEIPENFNFFRLESPHCTYYFNGLKARERTFGVISRFFIPEELINLYSYTATLRLLDNQLLVLHKTLEELLDYLPSLDKYDNTKPTP